MNRIQHSFTLAVPPEKVFHFYADPHHVQRMTPSELNLRIVDAQIPLKAGSRVTFAIRPRMIPFELHWLVEVVEFVENELFVDRLVKGPFSYWEHRHVFEQIEENATKVTDTIEYGSMSSILDRLVSAGFIRKKIELLFTNRELVLRRELERPADPASPPLGQASSP